MRKRLKISILIFIIFFGIFSRFYKLSELAMFVGDQGRDYLAAKDFLITHKAPFLGPQTSVPWLYLGPFFYYFLAFFLWLGKFNPLWPAYGTALFGVLAIYLIYILGKELFGEKTGLMAAFFYAVSPYAILQSRIALHPSILPVFEILFLIELTKILKTKNYPSIYCLLFTIYFLISVQLHLSAILLIPIGFLCWERVKFPKSTMLLRLFLGAVFFLTLVKIYKNSPFTQISHWWQMFGEIFSYGNQWPAFFSLVIVAFGIVKAIKDNKEGAKILLISLLVIVCGLTIKNSPAEHPYNLFLPLVILIFSYGLRQVSEKSLGNILIFPFCVFFLITNCYLLLTSNYFSQIYGPGLKARIQLAKAVDEEADGYPFILKRCGPLWDYPSTNMNYEYLVWWLNQGGRVEERESGKVGEAITYYIFEPKDAWLTKEGCEKVGEHWEKIFEFEQAMVLKVKE